MHQRSMIVVMALLLAVFATLAVAQTFTPGPYVVGGGAARIPGEPLNGYANMNPPGGETGQMQALWQGQPPPAPTYDLIYDAASGDYWVFLNGVYQGEVRILGGPHGKPPKWDVGYWAANGAPAGTGTWTG